MAAPPRVDTVTVTRTDTVVRTRTDTVTVTRVDTVTRIEELPLQPLGTWQFGIGVGGALPTGDWRNVVKDGYDIHAHVGWFPGASVFGIRLDGDYLNEQLAKPPVLRFEHLPLEWSDVRFVLRSTASAEISTSLNSLP